MVVRIVSLLSTLFFLVWATNPCPATTLQPKARRFLNTRNLSPSLRGEISPSEAHSVTATFAADGLGCGVIPAGALCGTA